MPVAQFRMKPWIEREERIVEFYPGEQVNVNVISINCSKITSKLNSLKDGNPICLDLEWKPEFNENEHHPIELFQFCSSKGILVILNKENSKKVKKLDTFLSSNEFFGKGLSVDRKKLNSQFGHDFMLEELEDRLEKNNLPLHFSSAVAKLIGKLSYELKDKKITLSDWSERPLSIEQILYASYDVYAIYKCREKLIEMGDDKRFLGKMQENDHIPQVRPKKPDITDASYNNFNILFVSNLPSNINSKEDLTELFSQCGTVQSATFSITPTSVKMGTVQMSTHDEALDAIKTFNNVQFGKDTMICKKFEQKQAISRSNLNIFVIDNMKENQFKKIFSSFGAIKNVLFHPADANSLGYAMALFENEDDAIKCMKYSPLLTYNNHSISVRYYRDKRQVAAMVAQPKILNMKEKFENSVKEVHDDNLLRDFKHLTTDQLEVFIDYPEIFQHYLNKVKIRLEDIEVKGFNEDMCRNILNKDMIKSTKSELKIISVDIEDHQDCIIRSRPPLDTVGQVYSHFMPIWTRLGEYVATHIQV